jgi:hypothetical protein
MSFQHPGTIADELSANVRKVIEHRSANSDRAKQKALGVSEIGEKCVRKLIYKMSGQAETNKSDPWASIQGTALHAWLADAFERFNDKDAPRFFIERRVEVNEGLVGTCDLFDTIDGVVIDHKCVGSSSMQKRKREGATEQQRIQINLYGLAYEKMGFTVKKVALVFYPIGGRLDGVHTIIEDYDRNLALAALDRYEGIKALFASLAPVENPDKWPLIPASPSSSCLFCPFYLPKSEDLSKGCPGEVNLV